MFGIALITVVVFSAIAAEDDRDFFCDFETTTCGFLNQEGLTALWQRRRMELHNKSGYMMVVESNDTSSQLAKVRTPYLEILEEGPACLSFDFYTVGIKHFSVQQETENFGIISIWSRDSKQEQKWLRPRIQTDVGAFTRFFFEAVLEGSKANSLAAVDNFQLDLKDC